MKWTDALLLVAVLLNTYAFVRQEIARRRVNARARDLLPCLYFTAWLSSDESGAPEPLRMAARAALPDGAHVVVERVTPESERVH